MALSEKLLQGLTNRIFEEVKIGFSQGLESFRELRFSKKRESLEIPAREAKRIFGQNLVALHLGGSRRKPYLALNVLAIDTEGQSNQWDERCLYGYEIINFPALHFIDWRHSNFNISEHVIYRLLQRSSLSYENLDTEFPKWHENLSFVPLWAAYWKYLFGIYVRGSRWSQFSVLVPAPGGLFLGQISPSTQAVELRTYVPEESLSSIQVSALQLMRDAQDVAAESSLSFIKILMTSGIDQSQCILAARSLSKRLINDERCVDLFREIFIKEMSDHARRLLINDLMVTLKYDSMLSV